LALFPTLSPFLPSPSTAPKSPWESSRLVVFLLAEGGQLDLSSCLMVESPMVLDSSSSTSFFSMPAQPPSVDLLLNKRHHLSLFASAVPALPLSATPFLPFVVSFSLLTFSFPSLVSFSLLPLSPFLLSTLSVVSSLPPGALPLPFLFVLQAPAHIFHYQSLTSKQS